MRAVRLLVVMMFAWGGGTGLARAAEECGDECAHDAVEEEIHHEGHEDHGDECGHGNALGISIEEIAEVRCEHDMPAYQCDSCRYEVGIVKVAASLMNQADGGGLVRTQKASTGAVVAGVKSTGEMQLNENATVHVTPRIPGVIASVDVDLGTKVEKGQTLFMVNSTELGKSLAAYRRGRALTSLARKTYEREKSLYEQKVTSEQELIEAQMAYEGHRTDLAAAEQTLHVLGLTEAELEARAEWHGTENSLLPVRAPIAGTILARHAVVGEQVEEGSDALLLADLGTLWVWIDVYEQDLGTLIEARQAAEIPVLVTVRAFPGRTFSGVIDYVGATMNTATRTVRVRGVVQNPDGLLRPGMFCQATITAGRPEEILGIPPQALLEDEGANFVFKHWQDDYYVRRAVKVGRVFEELVEVLEGIEPGDTIVTEGAFLLKSDILREKMGAGCAD